MNEIEIENLKGLISRIDKGIEREFQIVDNCKETIKKYNNDRMSLFRALEILEKGE